MSATNTPTGDFKIQQHREFEQLHPGMVDFEMIRNPREYEQLHPEPVSMKINIEEVQVTKLDMKTGQVLVVNITDEQILRLPAHTKKEYSEFGGIDIIKF